LSGVAAGFGENGLDILAEGDAFPARDAPQKQNDDQQTSHAY
jgi:hypothetical protein